MVTWDQDFQFLDDPGKDPDQRSVEQASMQYYLAPDKTGLGQLTDYRFSFFDIPDKDKETMQPHDEIMKAIMSNDVETTWNQIIQSHLANGYDKVIQEYNDAAKAAGMN
jgi:hypothetical protein